MFTLGREFGMFKDQLSLQNIEPFFKDVENITFFVENVSLKGSMRDYNEVGFRKAGQAFEVAASFYGAKIIPPLCILLLRVLDQNLGYIELHTLFLQLCNNFSVPKLALSILQRNALFKHITKTKILEFLVEGCDIYIKLGQYAKAYELIQRGKIFQSNDIQNSIKAYSRIIVLQINQKGGIQQLSEIKERLRFLLMKLNFDSELNKAHNQELYNQINFKLQFYASLGVYQQLAEVEKKVLQIDGLLQVYQSSKWTYLRRYIDEELKGNKLRIRAQEVKAKSLADFQVITGVNKNNQIYRYDCKNKIVYFNHKESDQQNLNSLITRAMNMSEEVLSCKIQRKENNSFEGRGMKMGGFGFGGSWKRQIQFFKRSG